MEVIDFKEISISMAAPFPHSWMKIHPKKPERLEIRTCRAVMPCARVHPGRGMCLKERQPRACPARAGGQ
ncbi:hypothetical protein [Acidovorax sp. A79]|uniref:hypothetical protein n=1 Tax=Acidovorax sp. A79 TaxID=3056107 RepID=UPI0034E8DC29